MTSLTYNENMKSFVLKAADDAACKEAKAAGLTLSSVARGPRGEKLFFTADHQQQPTDNPYAALPFWKNADRVAKNRLGRLYDDYQASWADSCDTDFPAPDRINEKTGEKYAYLPYQKAGIDYALKRGHTLIGDEPGLGKTIQAIGVANAIEAQRTLVICPASIRLNWQSEVREWSTLARPSTYPILKSKDGVNPFSNYTFISYDLLRNEAIHEALMDIDWDLMVLDEAHYLKTTDAKRTRAVFGGGRDIFKESFLAERAKKILALTGTPLPNRPRECYTLARALNWESIDWQSYDAFAYRYNPSGYAGSGAATEKKGRLPELRARLRSNFMVRRLKKDVLKDLPDKRYEFTHVEPNGAIRQVLAKEKLIDFDPGETLINPDFSLDGEIATVRREMGEAMVPRVCDHVEYLLDIVELPKLVIFSHHNSVMNELIENLHKYGIVGSRGGMSTTKKYANVKEFQVNPDVRIYLGQLDTMEGVDGLQGVADHCVFAEPAWTPGRNEQCVDRLHRLGQHSNVVAQFLLAAGSFNEKVLKSVLIKAKSIHETLDAGGS